MHGTGRDLVHGEKKTNRVDPMAGAGGLQQHGSDLCVYGRFAAEVFACFRNLQHAAHAVAQTCTERGGHKRVNSTFNFGSCKEDVGCHGVLKHRRSLLPEEVKCGSLKTGMKSQAFFVVYMT